MCTPPPHPLTQPHSPPSNAPNAPNSVVAWEPVPAFSAIMAYNLARNQLSHRVTLRRTVVANPPGSKQV